MPEKHATSHWNIIIITTYRCTQSSAPCIARLVVPVHNTGHLSSNHISFFSSQTKNVSCKQLLACNYMYYVETSFKQQAKTTYFLMLIEVTCTDNTGIKCYLIQMYSVTFISFCCWSFSKCSLSGNRSCLPPIKRINICSKSHCTSNVP